MSSKIKVAGATHEEFNIIRAALNLYRTRTEEKHTDAPDMGFGASAKLAASLEERLECESSAPLMYESLAEYEGIVGYKVNDVFSSGWRMARCRMPSMPTHLRND